MSSRKPIPELVLVLLVVISVATWTSVASAELQGWRTPDGKLYFGAEPPPGSTKFEAPTPTPRIRPAPLATASPTPSPAPTPTVSPSPPSPSPTAPPTPTPQPTETPERTATPQPTPAPTLAPTNGTPEAGGGRPPTAAAGERPAAPSARSELADCRQFVEIRNSRPTIDFDSDVVRVNGEVVVTGGPVREVAVCIGGSCNPLARGRALQIGDRVPFSVSASRHRPTGLTVRCVLPPGR